MSEIREIARDESSRLETGQKVCGHAWPLRPERHGDDEVFLPDHLDPIGQPFDLRQPAQLRYVYELVLMDGTQADVRRFVDADTLRRIWPTLHLPDAVRTAWRALIDDSAPPARA